MEYLINRAVVIGAGTMGAALAAHLTNAGIRVTLLDIVPGELTEEEREQGLSLEDPAVRNRLVRKGYQDALQAKPANFYTRRSAELITLGNLEDDFEAVSKADWVLEAVVENLGIKRDLMARIDEHRGEKTLISSNTSGISIRAMAEGRSAGFQEHFLGTHFFNPPRYLKLLEVIPTAETLPEVVEFFKHFGEYRLGKGVVICKDTPNFIANRLGFASGSYALHTILEQGLTVKEVDRLTGPLIGRPKTGTFRLIDLVGIDIWHHVGENLSEALPEDDQAMPYLTSGPVSGLINTMLEKNWLGNKTGSGFYKQVVQDGEKEYWPLDLETQEHRPPEARKFDSVGRAKKQEDLAERLNVLLDAEDLAGEFIRRTTYQSLAYASQRIPEISDTPRPIDQAMKWGFGHEAGPFELWDLIGVEESLPAMVEAGFQPADWVRDMVRAGIPTFYRYEQGQAAAVYHPEKESYQELPPRPRQIVLDALKKEPEKVLLRNTSATLLDLGDGVGCVEFHTKMNAIDEDTIDLISRALDLAEEGRLRGLVIGNDAEHFSAGANLFGVVMAAQNGMWDQLEAIVRKLQDVNMRMRYFPKPVVAAPAGMVLGGGAEILMHTSRVVAAAETYAGLVEVGAGVIPAGGGTKEMVRRVVNPPLQTEDVLVLPFLEKLFEQVGQGEVAKSAAEAREYGILGPSDRVVLNRSHLLAEAKREVLHLAGSTYRPPLPEKVYAAGRDALAALKAGLHLFLESGYITEYESVIGRKLSYVLTGGNLSRPTWLDEQDFLELEREAFLSLCGEEKTQERMWHLLRKGKVLRN